MIPKTLEGTPGYCIFFDNYRVDKYVKDFTVNLSSDGSIGTASFSFIYAPSFYRREIRDINGVLTESEDGIDDMTNVRVFIKNIFNNKYVMVFDGNIRGRGRSRTGDTFSLSFDATDYMAWLDRTLVPLSIPFANITDPGYRLRWLAQGVDITTVNSFTSNAQNSLKGKTLEQFIDYMKETTLRVNKNYTEKNSVAAWDGVMARMKVMGDISTDLVNNQVIDYIITSTNTSANSMFVSINDISRNLMFEFYQDRDGYIRIKPPFWNESVLYDHIIDPILITNFSEYTDWRGRVSRIVATGGREEWDTDATNTYFTPSGCFVGELNGANSTWTDYLSTT